MLSYLWATALLDCACDALEQWTTGRCPDRACVYNGTVNVPMDDCCEGQLWVAWGRTIPTDWKAQSFGSFPTRAPRTSSVSAACLSLIAFDFEIGIVRCAPTIDDEGNPPSCQEIERSAMQQHEDAWALLRGVLCCLRDFDSQGYYVSWEQQEPIEDEGACVGSVLRVSIGHEICPCIDLPEVPEGECLPEPPCDPEPLPEPPPGPPVSGPSTFCAEPAGDICPPDDD